MSQFRLIVPGGLNMDIVSLGVDHLLSTGELTLGGKYPGIALIPVDKNGKNQIYVLPGINADFSSDDLDKANKLLSEANIILTKLEQENLEVADFGLNDIKNIGLELIEYENNDRYCAKELILFPGQICPEHRHPPLNNTNPGKMETFTPPGLGGDTDLGEAKKESVINYV